jgi:lipoate-protein ligase A
LTVAVQADVARRTPHAGPPWAIVSTPPLSGRENMATDVQTLRRLHEEQGGPLLRFFRWNRPTVSYGRLQRREQISIPDGWDTIQRPTGGGVVFHDTDLCFSLCFRLGQPPLPLRFSDLYAWIHGVVQKALSPLTLLTMATCRDGASTPVSFMRRQCFNEPVAFDLLRQGRKIVGGAFCRQKEALLYQGSIQIPTDTALERRLTTAFGKVLGVCA